MADRGGLHNQMKFNLGVPISAVNLAARYHRPNPIIVERAGGLMNFPQQESSHPQVTRQTDAVNSSLNFSNASEDRLALAVRLAQLDLKKKRENPSQTRSRSPSPKFRAGKTKIVHTKVSRERAARLEMKRNNREPLRVRERGFNVAPKSRGTTTRNRTPPRNQNIDHLPATTNSPPTRDTDRYTAASGRQMETPGQEIDRMQREIEGYLQQIQIIEQRAMQEQTRDFVQPTKSRRRDGYLSDEEDPVRRQIRQEEQATRAARQVYFLRQQVKSLQEQVTRIGPGKARHTKKSQIMTRLAAAHRGAVRAIQSFVTQQLPQQNLQAGLPAGYHELAMLIRQLALVSTEISQGSDATTAHEDLLRMLDRVEELNKAWCYEREERMPPPDPVIERQRKSPVRTNTFGAPLQGRQPRPKLKPGKENRPKGLLKKTFRVDGRVAMKPGRQGASSLTPERQAVLRAGIEALVQDKSRSTDDRRLEGGAGGVVWNIPADTSLVEHVPKSLILPKGLQTKREKAKKSVSLDVPESHFSDPTVSSNLKMVDGNVSFSEPNSPGKDPWRPGGSAGASPGRQKRSRSHSPGHVDRSVLIEDVDTELVRELFPHGTDGQGGRGRTSRSRSRSPPYSSGRRSRSRSPGRGYSRGQVARSCLTAQDILMAQERRRELAGINVRQMISDRAIDKAEVNGEILSEMILHDLLHDMAEELDDLETQQNDEREARTLQHNPTMENLYQRLEQMELEQLDIRRRWGTLHFEEAETTNRRVNHAERPSGPVAMEITRRGNYKSHQSQSTRAFSKDADEPIIFTKSAPAPSFKQRIIPVSGDGDEEEITHADPRRGPRRIKLELPQKVVSDVHANLEKYERHLKRMSHETQGRFDPWSLVEEISDLVLDECLREVDAELQDMEEAIVHQVCKSEFAIPEIPPQQEVKVKFKDDRSNDAVSVESAEEPIEEVSPIESEDDYETVTDTEEDDYDEDDDDDA